MRQVAFGLAWNRLRRESFAVLLSDARNTLKPAASLLRSVFDLW